MSKLEHLVKGGHPDALNRVCFKVLKIRKALT